MQQENNNHESLEELQEYLRYLEAMIRGYDGEDRKIWKELWRNRDETNRKIKHILDDEKEKSEGFKKKGKETI